MSQDKELGINARVAKVLREAQGKSLTMGEIMDLAEIVKTSAPEVSSALYKLRNRGLVKDVRGPSSSSSGPKFVRRYVWVAKTPVATVKVQVQTVAVSPLQMLGIGRIR